MSAGFKRLAWVVATLWLLGWAFVAWRGYALEQDALSFIDSVAPGERIPQAVLNALGAGQSYQRNALIFGLFIPMAALLIGWVWRGFRQSSATSH
jgi:hypothetical protein